jgi:hypothetical protein
VGITYNAKQNRLNLEVQLQRAADLGKAERLRNKRKELYLLANQWMEEVIDYLGQAAGQWRR